MIPVPLVLGAVVGALVGVVFFGALRVSVDALAESRRPALTMLAGLLLRLAFALAAFRAVLGALGAGPLIAAAVAFALVRAVFVAMARRGMRMEVEG